MLDFASTNGGRTYRGSVTMGELASLACRAVFEIDGYRHKNLRNTLALEGLAEALSTTFYYESSSRFSETGTSGLDSGRRKLHNPSDISTVYHAVSVAQPSTNLKTVEDLLVIAEHLSKSLRDVASMIRDCKCEANSEGEEVEKLRKFCLALAEEALACDPVPYDRESTTSVG